MEPWRRTPARVPVTRDSGSAHGSSGSQAILRLRGESPARRCLPGQPGWHSLAGRSLTARVPVSRRPDRHESGSESEAGRAAVASGPPGPGRAAGPRAGTESDTGSDESVS